MLRQPFRVPVVGLLLLVLASSSAPRLQADEEAEAPSLSQLAWMAGHWSSQRDGVVQEELWLPPAGGLMLGLHRDSDDARQRAFFEYLRIEQRDDTLVYLAQPGGGEATAFTLDSLGDQRVVFTNPDHDFPQRITYWLGEDGALNAEAVGEIGGRTRSMSWRWERVEAADEE